MKVKKSLFKKEYYIENWTKNKFGPFSQVVNAQQSSINYAKPQYVKRTYGLTSPFKIFGEEKEYYVKMPSEKHAKDSKWSVVTEDGITSFACKDKIIAHCGNIGYVVQSEENGKYGLVGANGNYILECEFDFIGHSDDKDLSSYIDFILPVIYDNKKCVYDLRTKKLITFDDVYDVIVEHFYISTSIKRNYEHYYTYYNLDGNCIAKNIPLKDPLDILVYRNRDYFDQIIPLFKREELDTLYGLKNLLAAAYKFAISREIEDSKIDKLLYRYEDRLEDIDKRIAELTVPKEIVDRKREQALEKIDNTIANNNNY